MNNCVDTYDDAFFRIPHCNGTFLFQKYNKTLHYA